MQNIAEGGEEDIKVLPEEGLSVGIGGETYNPAFPRFSCQIIIFLSDYDWEQIVLEASSQTNGILIRHICCRWQRTSYTLTSFQANVKNPKVIKGLLKIKAVEMIKSSGRK